MAQTKLIKKSSVCALVSGGIDSCVMMGILAKNYAKVVPVYVRNRLIWEKTELYWLKKYLWEFWGNSGDTLLNYFCVSTGFCLRILAMNEVLS